VERERALRSLEAIQDAARRVRRHSLNNGVIPLVWGTIVLVGLPLFDFLPGVAAALAMAGLSALGGVWTGGYASRLAAVKPSGAALREYVGLMLGWTVYYAILMIVWSGLLVGHLAHAWTPLASLAAAPLLLGGWWMWRRSRG
jgi:hypothetical protein